MKYGIKYTEQGKIEAVSRFRDGIIASGFIEIDYNKYCQLLENLKTDPYGTYDGERFIPEDNDKKTLRLAKMKKEQDLSTIEQNKQKELSLGFEYDGQLFPLDEKARVQYSMCLMMHSSSAFVDTVLMTVSNDTYTLTSDHVLPFSTSFQSAINAINLKYQAQKEVINSL